MKKILSLVLLTVTFASCVNEDLILPSNEQVNTNLQITNKVGIKLETAFVTNQVNMNVKSDFDGVAVIKIKDIANRVVSKEEVNVKVGELFMGPGQIKIVNTTKLKLTAEVPENYAGKVKVGTELTLTFPDIQKTISNKISVLGNVINPLSRSFFIESKLPVDNNFRPNLLAQVKIKDYEKKNAISIPVNLLQNDEKGKFVYVAVTEAGKLVARKKVVTTGEFYGNNIEVLSGLAAGEILITEGFQSIYDGQLITKTIQ